MQRCTNGRTKCPANGGKTISSPAVLIRLSVNKATMSSISSCVKLKPPCSSLPARASGGPTSKGRDTDALILKTEEDSCALTYRTPALSTSVVANNAPLDVMCFRRFVQGCRPPTKLTVHNDAVVVPAAFMWSSGWSSTNRSADGISRRSLMMGSAPGAVRLSSANMPTAHTMLHTLASAVLLAPWSSNAWAASHDLCQSRQPKRAWWRVLAPAV